MVVRVRLSQGLADHIGRSRITVSVPEGSCVADVVAAVKADYSELGLRLESAVAVVGGQHVPLSESITGQEEVALLLPVAGG